MWRLPLRRVSWHLMIVIVPKIEKNMVFHECSYSMKILPRSRFLNSDWVPWFSGDGNCALIEFCDIRRLPRNPGDGNCALIEFRGIQVIAILIFKFHIMPWLLLDRVWELRQDSGRALNLYLTVIGFLDIRSWRLFLDWEWGLSLDRVRWYPMIAIVPTSHFTLCHDWVLDRVWRCNCPLIEFRDIWWLRCRLLLDEF